MIEIWEPRYRDKTVLIATNKIRAGQDVDLEITKGFYKGRYLASKEIVANSPREFMKTKKGGEISVTIVSLDKLKKVE